MLIWNGLLSPMVYQLLIEVEQIGTCQVHISCLQGVRNVDYLLMAKLAAISTFENPPRFSELSLFC
jgi:hypothetical protein